MFKGIMGLLRISIVAILIIGQAISASALDTLSPAIVSGNISPARSAVAKGDAAHLLEPGAIGNGAPLIDLISGKLPPRVEWSNDSSEAEKLRKAINIAIRAHIAGRSKIPDEHTWRSDTTLRNLINLRNGLSGRLYLYNAVVIGGEDYLLGFNAGDSIGLSTELIDILYEISPRRLAQYIYHECIPEDGAAAERADHRRIYSQMQKAIFGEEDVKRLGQDLRAFIAERVDAHAVKEMSLDKFKSVLIKLFDGGDRGAEISNLQFNGPVKNSVLIKDLLDKNPSVFQLKPDAIGQLRSLVALLAQDSRESREVVDAINEKFVTSFNRQQFLAAILYWATNDDVKKRFADTQTSADIFTEEDRQRYLAMARAFQKEGAYERALQYYGYVLNLTKVLNRDMEAMQSEALGAFESARKDIIARSGREDSDEDANYSVFAQTVRILLNKGAIGLAGFMAIKGKERFPEKTEEFIGAIRGMASLLQSGKEVDYHFTKAMEHLKNGEKEAAIYHAKICVSMQPTESTWYLNLGTVFSNAGMEHDAVIAYERALKLAPEDRDIYTCLGSAYNDIGLRIKALDIYKRGIKLFEDALAGDPRLKSDTAFIDNYNALLYNMGNFYEEQGNLEAARLCYEKGLSLKPNDGNCTGKLAEINIKLASLGKKHNPEATRGIHFLYGFLLTRNDANAQINDFAQILAKAREENRRVHIIYSFSVITPDIVRNSVAGCANDPRLFLRCIGDREILRKIYDGISVSADKIFAHLSDGTITDAEMKVFTENDEYNKAWFEFLSKSGATIEKDGFSYDAASDFLKAMLYYEQMNEAIKSTSAGDIDLGKLLNLKKLFVSHMVASLRKTNTIIFGRATQIKYEDPSSVVVVVRGIFNGGSERQMAEKGYDVGFYYPCTSGFSNYLVPEYEIMTRKMSDNSEPAEFTKEDEKALLKSVIGDLLLTMSSSENTFTSHQIVRRIMDRISDEDLAAFASDIKRDEDEAKMQFAAFAIKWLLLRAKITDENLKYFPQLTKEMVAGLMRRFQSDDINYLLKQITHPNTVVAKQSARTIGRLAKGIDKLMGQLTQVFCLSVVDEAKSQERNARNIVELYILNPKTQLQYMAAVALTEMGVVEGVELDDSILKHDANVVVEGLLSEDNAVKADARQRVYRDGLFQDLVDGYLEAESADEATRFVNAFAELNDKQISNRLIEIVFSGDEKAVLKAIRAIRILKEDRAVLPLLYQLSHNNLAIRSAAHRAVVNMGRKALGVIQDILGGTTPKMLTGSIPEIEKIREEIASKIPPEAKAPPKAVSPGILNFIDTEEVEFYAEQFKSALIGRLCSNPERTFALCIDSDIGASSMQKDKLMAIYRAVDSLTSMVDSKGKKLFPNLIVKRSCGEKLALEIKGLVDNQKILLNDVFLVAQKSNVDAGKFELISGEGKAWTTAIDDSMPANYLPIFEAATIMLMAASSADADAIKDIYDVISDKPVDPGVLNEMLNKRIIYILPKAGRVNTEHLKEVYDIVARVYTAA